jgi:hypothetical protein
MDSFEHTEVAQHINKKQKIVHIDSDQKNDSKQNFHIIKHSTNELTDNKKTESWGLNFFPFQDFVFQMEGRYDLLVASMSMNSSYLDRKTARLARLHPSLYPNTIGPKEDINIEHQITKPVTILKRDDFDNDEMRIAPSQNELAELVSVNSRIITPAAPYPIIGQIPQYHTSIVPSNHWTVKGKTTQENKSNEESYD